MRSSCCAAATTCSRRWARRSRRRATRSGWPPTSSTTTPSRRRSRCCWPRPRAAACRCAWWSTASARRRTLAAMREWMVPAGVELAVFRPIDRWWSYFQPGQARRLHQKLCVVDGEVAFVGGINLIADRNDLHHGWSDAPRLDFAVPPARPRGGRGGAVGAGDLDARDARPRVARRAREPGAQRRADGARAPPRHAAAHRAAASAPIPATTQPPVSLAFVVRDNLRQRRSIERVYMEAIQHARHRIDLVTPYFYPDRHFRNALAARGRARREGAAAAAGQDRLPHRRRGRARAVRRAAGQGRADLRVHAGLPAREDGGRRRRLGHARQLQHRSAVAAAQPRGQRRRVRRAVRAAACPRSSRSRWRRPAPCWRRLTPRAGSRCCGARSSRWSRTGSCAWPASMGAIDAGRARERLARIGAEAVGAARAGHRAVDRQQDQRADRRARSGSAPTRPRS